MGGVPAALWRWFLPETASGWAMAAAGVVAVTGAILILGISLR